MKNGIESFVKFRKTVWIYLDEAKIQNKWISEIS